MIASAPRLRLCTLGIVRPYLVILHFKSPYCNQQDHTTCNIAHPSGPRMQLMKSFSGFTSFAKKGMKFAKATAAYVETPTPYILRITCRFILRTHANCSVTLCTALRFFLVAPVGVTLNHRHPIGLFVHCAIVVVL